MSTSGTGNHFRPKNIAALTMISKIISFHYTLVLIREIVNYFRFIEVTSVSNVILCMPIGGIEQKSVQNQRSFHRKVGTTEKGIDSRNPLFHILGRHIIH